jgi:trigger factor
MKLKNVEKLEKNMVVLTVDVEKDEFETAIEKAYKKQVKKLNIPGFRKGHAPRKVVEGMFGVEVFFDDAMNFAFPEAYQAAVGEAKIEPVGYPEVEPVGDVTVDGFTFKATVANYPEVKLGEYKGLSAVKPSAEVNDDVVAHRLDELAERNARLVSVDRAAEKGDTAVIDFEGFKDGKAFEGGKGENYTLELGSGTFIPGFEEQVEGMKAGEEKDIDVTFPEDYQAEDLAGKPVVFHVKVNEVKFKELPAMDDDFAQDVSEFDTIDALKADIRKKAEEQAKADSDRAFENALMDKVIENMECDVPEPMIENQVNNMMNDYKMQITSQGMAFDQYLKMVGTTEDDLRETAKEPALRQIRVNLALEAIIKAENPEVTDEEIEQEFKDMAEKYSMGLDDVKKYLKAEDVSEQLKRKKARDIIISSATAETK